MIASVINALLVFLGGVLGMIFKNHISEKMTKAITSGLSLCVLSIGISSAIKTENTLCVIICIVLGIAAGELLRIEDRLDGLGKLIKDRLLKKRDSGRFTEGFMSTTLLFCIGSMAIMGAMEAGINGDYGILLSKSVIDGVSAMTFSAVFGIGVCFSAISVLLYQGSLTLLAIWLGPILPDSIVNEMSAVGGLLIVGLSINMLGLLGEGRVRVGNMLPSVFLPIAYIPLSCWISSLF